jgi:hypothetical protein
MWACVLMPNFAEAAVRSTMREKPGAESGAPRSETNTIRSVPGEQLMRTDIEEKVLEKLATSDKATIVIQR